MPSCGRDSVEAELIRLCFAIVACGIVASLLALPAVSGAAESSEGVTPTEAAQAVSPTEAVTPVNAAPNAARTADSHLLAPTVAEQLQVEQEEVAAERAQDEAEQARKTAEKAHREALEQALQARTTATRNLAHRRATIETARIGLAAIQEKLAGRRVNEAKRARKRLELENNLFARAVAPELSASDADTLYDELVVALEPGWRELELAMDAMDQRTQFERLPPMPEIDRLTSGQMGEQALVVKQALADALAHEDQLVEEDERLRRVVAAAAAQHVIRLNRVRSASVAMLSEERADAISGLGSEGYKELTRELRHLALLIRWTPHAWMRTVAGHDGLRDDLPGRSDLGLAFLRLMALLFIWLMARNRVQGTLQKTKRTVMAQVRSPGLRRILSPLLRLLVALGRELLLLALVTLAAGDLIGMGTLGEFAVLHALLLTWAWYRLAFVAANRYLHAAASLRSVKLSDQASERILWSLRLVGRYIFAVVALHVFTSHAVGEGFILKLVIRFSWLGALPIFVLLLRHWRQPIVTTYLEHFPQSELADRVRASQGQAAGSVIALSAFAFVAVRGITLYLRDVALQFEQTRRALAYLFRRRLERHAEQLQAPPNDLSVLPEVLRGAFDGQPMSSTQAVGDAPGQDDLLALIEAWNQGDSSHSVMVFGEHGIGRTTWMGQVAAASVARCGDADFKVHQAAFDDRITKRADLCRFVATACGVEPTDELQELIETLHAGPRRLVLLDDCQRALLRSMDGLSAWRALCEITVHTAPNVFWICSCTSSAWRFARSLQRGRNIFSRMIQIRPWSEERIDAMIRAGMTRAGFEAVYDDLILDEVQTGLEAEGMRVGERYMRLLWGYANGNPRDAGYFWLRSLVPDGERRVRVRLFRSPGANELEKLAEFGRFVLAAVVQHETLTAAEMARALGEPERDCRAILAFLTARGYLARYGERYEVDRHWHRAVLNYLKRKHLAYD